VTRNAFLFPLLLLSGFCGLSYEVLLGRVLGNLAGDQFAVSAAVLIAFLSGVGLGSLAAHRLWRWLWLVELGIGITGVLFVLGQGWLDSWIYRAAPQLGSAISGTVLVCVVVLLLPAFLIGCSLPLFAGYLDRARRGAPFAHAYTIYNFGAAVTVLAIEFWLLRAVGLTGAVLAIAGINLTVALTLRFGFADLAQQPAPAVKPLRFTPRQIIALAVASLASAIFQLLLVKIAEFLFGPFRESFALVLALILLGIAVGSQVAARARMRFTTAMGLTLLGLVWLLGAYEPLVIGYAANFGALQETTIGAVLLKVGLLVLLVGLPVLGFGATIPAVLAEQSQVTKESGQLLFVSSMANVAGFVLMAFYLHSELDYGSIVILIGVLAAVALIVYPIRGIAAWAGAGTSLVCMVLLVRGVWDENLLYLGHAAFHGYDELQEARKDLKGVEIFKHRQDVMAINIEDDKEYFFINGYVSIPLDSVAENLVGTFSSLFAPRNERALVLGVGSGKTASGVNRLFRTTDAVEINPAIVENLPRLRKYNLDLDRQAGIRFHIDDAIHFVKRCEQRYDLIVNTVTTPLFFSSSKLYTADFFSFARQCLASDGVYVTWMDSRVGERGVEIILKTLESHFEHVALAAIRSSYYLLLASPAPIELHAPRLTLTSPQLAAYYAEQESLNPDWLSFGLLTTSPLDYIADSDAPLNTLDYPALEFEMTRIRHRGFNDFKDWLRDHLDSVELQAALGTYEEYNLQRQALHLAELLGTESRFTERVRSMGASRYGDGFEASMKEEGLAMWQRIAETADTPDVNFNVGLKLLRADRCQEAIPLFEKTLAADPGYSNAHYNLGVCYKKLEQPAQALRHYRLELEVDPRDADAQYWIGRLLYHQRRYQEALLAFGKALAMTKDRDLTQQILRWRKKAFDKARARSNTSLEDELTRQQLGAAGGSSYRDVEQGYLQRQGRVP
jgi:spermidine synthase